MIFNFKILLVKAALNCIKRINRYQQVSGKLLMSIPCKYVPTFAQVTYTQAGVENIDLPEMK